MLYGRAGERLAELMPPPSLERKLVGARIVLRDLARLGVTSIADVARLDALSRRALFHTHVERSASDLEIFRELQRREELTVRVYALLTLPLWKGLAGAGIAARTDEGLIRYGGLKAFVDGYLMEEPYASNPRYAGSFTFRFVDPETMHGDIVGADRAGFDAAVHTIGDKAHRLLLDWYEAAFRQNPPRDRRFRVIHAEYPRLSDVARMGRLGLIADITPQHLLRNVRGIERMVGPERARNAYPWASLIRAGVRVNLVSDLPGSFNEQEAKPWSPLESIALAVTRRPADGSFPEGWHPEERLTAEQAVAAYTINPAFSSYEEDRKGSIREGKLADLVVLSRDILSLPPEAIPTAQVELTILGGKVIYWRRE
jgi:predicted amidohydrolase YtcJ